MDNINQQFQEHASAHHAHFSGPAKIIMGAIFGALLFVAVVFMVFATINEIKEGSYIGQDIAQKNTISITGEGKISAKPDIGMVSLSVLSEATTVAAAQKDNTEKMNKVIKGIKDLGVEEKDLKTTNYNIYPKYQYLSGRSSIIGYEVNQSLEIKIRQLDKVSAILSKATELGANQIGSLAFTFDDPEGLKAEARKKAIANAKEKAEVLTDELGVALGRIISFSESSSPYQPPIYYMDKAVGLGGGGASPEIEAGQNEINAVVTITYEIK